MTKNLVMVNILIYSLKKSDFFSPKVFWFFDFGHLFLSIFAKPKIKWQKKCKKVIVTIMLSFPFFGFSVCDDNFFSKNNFFSSFFFDVKLCHQIGDKSGTKLHQKLF